MSQDGRRGCDDYALCPDGGGNSEGRTCLPEPRLVSQEAVGFGQELLGPRTLEAIKVEPEPSWHTRLGYRYRQRFLLDRPFGRPAMGPDDSEPGDRQRPGR